MANKQHPNRRALILCSAVLLLAALAVGLWCFRSPFPRLEVGGFRITEEEYIRAMYQARNDVLSDHAAVSHSLTDWSAETPLGDPRRLTMERALEILSEYYAVGTLAVERGYLSEAGYEAMKRDMEQVNEKRQEALESGAVITGFPSFTMEDYITYRASGLRLQFCTDPDNPEYLSALDRIEHGGAAYRQQAGNFRGFTMGFDPCTNMCLCYLMNIFCCGGRGMFCCI